MIAETTKTNCVPKTSALRVEVGDAQQGTTEETTLRIFLIFPGAERARGCTVERAAALVPELSPR